MKHRILLFCTLSLSILLITGCSFGKKDVQKEDQIPVNPNPAETTTEDQKTYDNAVMTRDETLCAQIKNVTAQERCHDSILLQEASLGKDEDKCAAISDPEVRKNCTDDLLFNEAGEKVDERICNRISVPEKKDLCRQNVRGLKNMPPPPSA